MSDAIAEVETDEPSQEWVTARYRQASAFLRLVIAEVDALGIACKSGNISPCDALAELDALWAQRFPLEDCTTCARFRQLGQFGAAQCSAGRA